MRGAIAIALVTGCGGATSAGTSTSIPTSTPAATSTATLPGFDDSPPPPQRFVTRTIGERSGTDTPRWTGRVVDLDLRSADIRDVCRLLADVGQINIVVSDDVTGQVTVKMKGVPWDQALDVILRSRGYVSERDGRVVVVTRAAAPR